MQRIWKIVINMSDSIKQQGFVVITPTIIDGDIIAWTTEDANDEAIPVIYPTAEAAWKEIADTMVTCLRQFINGEREFEDTEFATEDYVAPIDWYDDDSIAVWDEMGNPIIEITLKEWRKQR